MRLPLWIPTRSEVYGRSLKWLWRFCRLLAWPEPRVRALIKAHIEQRPKSDREWMRFARFIDGLPDEADVGQ